MSLMFYSLVACGDDELVEDPSEFPPLNRGEIEVNRYLLTFIHLSDTNIKQTVEFYDADGIGGALPTIRDTLFLKKPVSDTLLYMSKIKMYMDTVDRTDEIIASGTEYIICYRGFNHNTFRTGRNNLDKNGVNLGTEIEWTTVSDGNANIELGRINVTLNYQPNEKVGLCDLGIRILEGSIPYQLN